MADGLRERARRVVGESAAGWVSEKELQLSDWHYRALSVPGRRHRNVLKRFRGIHRGERCVIIGNGPSLRDTDLSLLASETTFGMNRIYILLEEMGFSTTYYTCINELVIEQVHEDIAALQMPRFLRASTEHLFRPAPNLGFLRSRYTPHFATDITRGLWEGATVTYVALQLAYYMGFGEVVLVGVDHNFTTQGPANKAIVSVGADSNHFHPDYFGKGFRWQLPDLETSEIAYAMARTAYESDGRRIVDATVGGKLEIFEKIELAQALR